MKHKRKDRPVDKKLSLPMSVVSRVDAHLRDPLTQRPPHGLWAKLITALLIKWLDGEVKVTIPLRQAKPLDDFLNDLNTAPEIQKGTEESV